MKNRIIYEQPLNELIRVCLRLEQLFIQVDYHIKQSSKLATRQVMTLIIQLLQLLDRPDLKPKLAKELSHQATLLERLANEPEVDSEKLESYLRQLNELSRCFIDSSKKIGSPLRQIEILNSLRLQLANPGGGCSFDVPLYHYWLQQPEKTRQQTLKTWLVEFDSIRTASSLILQLVRENGRSEQISAEHGFYQTLLNPQINLRLVRVAIPEHISAYPEISIGRHFLSVRFFSPSIENRPTQYVEHLAFLLTHCNAE